MALANENVSTSLFTSDSETRKRSIAIQVRELGGVALVGLGEGLFVIFAP